MYNIDIDRIEELVYSLKESINYNDNLDDIAIELSLIEDWARNSQENLK